MIPIFQFTQQVNTEIDTQVELIDTYDLFAGILTELGGLNSFCLKLDNTLPLIYGERQKVKNLGLKFLGEFLKSKKSIEKDQQFQVSYSKDRHNWIFMIQSISTGGKIKNLKSLSFPKGTIQGFLYNTPFKYLAS